MERNISLIFAMINFRWEQKAMKECMIPNAGKSATTLFPGTLQNIPM